MALLTFFPLGLTKKKIITFFFRVNCNLYYLPRWKCKHLPHIGQKSSPCLAKWLLRNCQVSERYLTVFLQEVLIFPLIMCHLQRRICILHVCLVAYWQSVIHCLVMKHELWSLLKWSCVWYSTEMCYIFPHQYTLFGGLGWGGGSLCVSLCVL